MTSRVSLPALLACLTLLGVNVADALAAEPCPNAQARTESNVNPVTGAPYSTQLPDCRAYELVSPPDSGGIPALALGGEGVLKEFIATADGSVFFASEATPAGTGAIAAGRWLNVFRSRRTLSGWVTRDLTAFGKPETGSSLLLTASTDGSAVLIYTPRTLSPEDVNNPTQNPTLGVDLYVVREGSTPLLVSHGELPNTSPSPEQGFYGVAAGPFPANPELSAVGFRTHASLQRPLSPGESTNGCYLWADVGARLAYLTNREGPLSEAGPPNCKLFAVMPDGRAIIEDTSGFDRNTGLIFASGGGASFPVGGRTVRLSGETPGVAGFDALAPDGKTAYITSTDPLDPVHNNEGRPSIYAVSTTTGSNAGAPCISCVGGSDDESVRYLGQSVDGSHAFFSTDQGLWSWARQSGEASGLTKATDVSKVVSSQNGQFVIGLTSQLAANPHGTADVYEFAAGQLPKLITSGTSADNYALYAQDRAGNGEHVVGGVSDDGTRVVYGRQPAGGDPEVIDEWVSSGQQTSQLSPLGSAHGYQVQDTAGAELEDVFFEANNPLVAQDLNAGTPDIYDARIGGGIRAPTETANNNQTPNPVGPTTPPYGGSLAPPSLQIGPLPADTSHPANTPRVKHLTRAQRLAIALKACKKDKSRSKRTRCEREARKRYGAKSTAKKHTARKGKS